MSLMAHESWVCFPWALTASPVASPPWQAIVAAAHPPPVTGNVNLDHQLATAALGTTPRLANISKSQFHQNSDQSWTLLKRGNFQLYLLSTKTGPNTNSNFSTFNQNLKICTFLALFKVAPYLRAIFLIETWGENEKAFWGKLVEALWQEWRSTSVADRSWGEVGHIWKPWEHFDVTKTATLLGKSSKGQCFVIF